MISFVTFFACFSCWCHPASISVSNHIDVWYKLCVLCVCVHLCVKNNSMYTIPLFVLLRWVLLLVAMKRNYSRYVCPVETILTIIHRFILCCILLWFVTGQFYPHPSGLLPWPWSSHTIAPVTVKPPLRVGVNLWLICTGHNWKKTKHNKTMGIFCGLLSATFLWTLYVLCDLHHILVSITQIKPVTDQKSKALHICLFTYLWPPSIMWTGLSRICRAQHHVHGPV